jgi:uncharacterized sporulation protein YeaH/YhbH (DUF444 family)
MSRFIDRRLNGKNKSMVNRERFIRRFKKQIKKAVSEAISNRNITNIAQGEVINIPTRDLREPSFQQGQGGIYEKVFPGNKEFSTGDKIKRPQSQNTGAGQSNNASNNGEGEDNFIFEISREEFLELFFEDLELPNLVKKHLQEIETQKTIRSGYTSHGVPANINIVRSMRGAIGRRMALKGAHHKKIKQLQEELNNTESTTKKADILEEIKKIEARVNNIPFIDSFDIKYNNRILQPTPSTGAVMFCIMDVSGSMDEAKKDIAKRFFILLYLFLTKTYNKIKIIFIRHHTSAKEVTEEEFFYSRETGGTVVSSALELTRDIINTQYSSQDWNIYVAQASDGDNWNNDSPHCRNLIINNIMPFIQHFSYIEIMPRHHQSLWEVYTDIQNKFSNFSMQHIRDYTDIYPVFRSLFKKKANKV